MIRANLNAILEQKGKTLYWLSKRAKIRYATLHKLANADELRKVDMRNVDRICRALDCEIQDLLVRVEDD